MKDGAGKIVQWNNQPPPCRRRAPVASPPGSIQKVKNFKREKKSVHQILPWDFAIFLVQDVNQLLVKWFTQGINLDKMFNMIFFLNMQCTVKQKKRFQAVFSRF